LKLKPGVIWTDMHPAIEASTFNVDNIYKELGSELVVTAGRDGKHMEGSLHYVGRAYDVRTWNLLDVIVQRIKKELGPNFDVVREDDHIHIEFDPK